MKVTVLIIDDEDKLRKLLSRIVSLEGYSVLEAASLTAARQILGQGQVDLILCDVKLPDGSGVDFVAEVKSKYPHLDIILLTAYGNIPDGVLATKNGAFDYIVKGDDNDKIIPLLAQASAKIVTRLRSKTIVVAEAGTRNFNQIIGESTAIKSVVALARKVAPTDASVLLTGETGTGKEVFAQAIHAQSRRHERAFVALNCSAFSKDLLESELFGHKAGAFTGASKDRSGLVDAANGGTLFLDEIGELPADLQPKLLRLLEDGSYYVVGDPKVRKADVRIISATNRTLDQEIASGNFRSDLYYRISTFAIELPPLRERPEDIPIMAEHFLKVFAAKSNNPISSISDDAMQALKQARWKGNVRELKNVLERAVILEEQTALQRDSLPAEMQTGTDTAGQSLLQLAAVEKAHIRKVLAFTKGNKAEAARLLGIGIATLYRKIDEYGMK